MGKAGHPVFGMVCGTRANSLKKTKLVCWCGRPIMLKHIQHESFSSVNSGVPSGEWGKKLQCGECDSFNYFSYPRNPSLFWQV